MKAMRQLIWIVAIACWLPVSSVGYQGYCYPDGCNAPGNCCSPLCCGGASAYVIGAVVVASAVLGAVAGAITGYSVCNQGPNGPPRPPGPQGPQGPQGPPFMFPTGIAILSFEFTPDPAADMATWRGIVVQPDQTTFTTGVLLTPGGASETITIPTLPFVEAQIGDYTMTFFAEEVAGMGDSILGTVTVSNNLNADVSVYGPPMGTGGMGLETGQQESFVFTYATSIIS